MLLQGVTPLAIAVCRDHKPMVELLLSKGAHPTCVVFNAVGPCCHLLISRKMQEGNNVEAT